MEPVGSEHGGHLVVRNLVRTVQGQETLDYNTRMGAGCSCQSGDSPSQVPPLLTYT